MRRAGWAFLAFVGGGLPALAQGTNEGLHYFAIEDMASPGTVIRRGIAGSNGVAFPSGIIVSPSTRYRIHLLQAATLLVGQVEVTTPAPGLFPTVNLPPFQMHAATGSDDDADDLLTIHEHIVGTDPLSPDTDGDLTRDGPEVIQGSDPLDGIPARTGLVASIQLPGETLDLCSSGDLLLAAHTGGVTGLNVFASMQPEIIARVGVQGEVTRVACSGRRAAVAAGTGGLALLDLQVPSQARVSFVATPVTLGGLPRCVAAATEVAYVGLNTGVLVALDMTTGLVLSRVSLGEEVQDCAVWGDHLYALTTHRLHALQLDPSRLLVTGSAASTNPQAFRRLTVGGGIAYAVHPSGYDTFNLAAPAAPVLLRANVLQQTGWRDMAVDGTGFGLAAASGRDGLPGDLEVYDVRDPAQFGTFVTTYVTPGAARAVEVSNGRAFVAEAVANGLSGVQVIQFVAFDTGNVPPTITLQKSFGGTSVEEGKLVFVRAETGDDHQVRNVEFTIDGVTTNDTSWPFELQFVTPRLASQPSFTLRARVFDTNGNFTTTAEEVISLTPDGTAPVVLRTVPAQGSLIGAAGAVAAFTDEPLAAASVNAASFLLVEAGPDGSLGTSDDVPVTASSIEVRAEVLGAFFVVQGGLPAGRYRADLLGSVTDTAGNALGTPTTWSFFVYGDLSTAPDADQDGIPDAIELALSLDPNDPDTGNTGVLDGDRDPDLDGLSTRVELLLGYDPRAADSLGDGTLDGARDRDGDRLTDGSEIALSTSPFSRDTDQDDFEDKDELDYGGDPRDPTKKPLLFAQSQLGLQNQGNLANRLGTAVQGPVALKNDRAPPIGTAVNVTSVKNTAAHSAVAGQVEGPSFSVQNVSGP